MSRSLALSLQFIARRITPGMSRRAGDLKDKRLADGRVRLSEMLDRLRLRLEARRAAFTPQLQAVSNARINPPGDNGGTDKFSTTGRLTPVGFNELLDAVTCAVTSLR